MGERGHPQSTTDEVTDVVTDLPIICERVNAVDRRRVECWSKSDFDATNMFFVAATNRTVNTPAVGPLLGSQKHYYSIVPSAMAVNSFVDACVYSGGFSREGFGDQNQLIADGNLHLIAINNPGDFVTGGCSVIEDPVSGAHITWETTRKGGSPYPPPP